MNLLFLGTHADVPYLAKLKPLVRTAGVFIITQPVSTLAEVEVYCQKKNISGVITTNQHILAKLMPTKDWKRSLPSLDNYAGSMFFTSKGLPIVAINPLEHLIKVSYASFLTEKYISKLTAPQEWEALRLPSLKSFKWELITATNFEGAYKYLQDCDAISVDIETIQEQLRITCVGFTGVKFTPAGIDTKSFVLPLDSSIAVAYARKLADTRVPKVLQNGKYDINYLLRYGIILWGYMWDTATMMHSWYSELPKDLASLAAFCIRDARYWKDLAKTNDLQEYYKYNALDSWNTALILCSWIQQAPDWAKRNYLAEFPINFPCILSEMTGIKRDMQALARARAEQDAIIATHQKKLDKYLGIPEGKHFNVNSPKQVKTLLTVLGCKDWESGDEKHLMKASFLHPLNDLILGEILEIRGARKLVSTYLPMDEDKKGGKEFNGRILYSLVPHGTDTGRLASKEHHFWCGLQLQNIPRGPAVKQTLRADSGFLFGEADLEQAESRDTAFISGDEALIKAVSGTRDFHSVNASAFFGVSYSEIYDDEKKKVKDKPLRDLSKRTNHGANYNMGANVMVDTMGLKNVRAAQKLLKLPKFWTFKQVCQYLLDAFHKTYTGIRLNYYAGMLQQVLTTKMLVSKATHIPHEQDEWSKSCYNVALWYEQTGGWTRYCFGRPDKNKNDLNGYIAHEPQSLNAMTLNKAFMRVFYEIAINPKHSANYKLLGQIHDSIPHLYREGHEYLSEMTAKCMEIPVRITSYDGKVREFTVPSDAKMGGTYWSDLG